MIKCDNTKCTECGFLKNGACMIGKTIKDTRVLPNTDGLTFGEKLRAIRKARGWSQKQLADKAGFSQMQVSAYERNLTNPSLLLFECLCKALNVKSNIFLDF